MLYPVADLKPESLPEGDAIVATAWRTANVVADADDRSGTKYYFIQHYEVWDGTEAEVDATWRLPLHRIVVSSWLASIAERLGVEVAGTVLNGVATETFRPRPEVAREPKTVGMLYHVADWKGVDDGLEAVKLARKQHPALRLLMFGAYHLRFSPPPYVEFHFRPAQDELPYLYNRCGVWLSPSWVEGGGSMPSHEAMASGCAVVSTDAGAARDLAVDGESILLSPPRDPIALSRNLVRVLDDPELASSLGARAVEQIAPFTWDRAAKGFLEILEQTLGEH
jgi:glycosyltransferase involved in cell wall biosynthesis